MGMHMNDSTELNDRNAEKAPDAGKIAPDAIEKAAEAGKIAADAQKTGSAPYADYPKPAAIHNSYIDCIANDRTAHSQYWKEKLLEDNRGDGKPETPRKRNPSI